MERRIQIFYGFAVASLVLVAAGLFGTFGPEGVLGSNWPPIPMLERQLGFAYKIFFFHVPMAITSGIAFGVTLVCSVMFLWKKDKKWDTWAAAGAELGLVFGAMLLTMGIIWGRASWNVWWTWDPRLTSYLIVVLLYSGYFVLRSAVDDEAMRARLSAALGIPSFITVIFTMIAPRIVRSIHPAFSLSDMSGSPFAMKSTFIVALVSIFALFGAMLLARVSIANLSEEVEHLKNQVGR